jgi:hypothetical protein
VQVELLKEAAWVCNTFHRLCIVGVVKEVIDVDFTDLEHRPRGCVLDLKLPMVPHCSLSGLPRVSQRLLLRLQRPVATHCSTARRNFPQRCQME